MDVLSSETGVGKYSTHNDLVECEDVLTHRNLIRSLNLCDVLIPSIDFLKNITKAHVINSHC